MLEAERDDVDLQLAGCRVDRDQGEEPLLELPDREAGGIDDMIRHLPRPGQDPSLLGDARLDPAALRLQGVAVPGLAEPADQHVVAGLEEHDPRHDPPSLERAAHPGE